MSARPDDPFRLLVRLLGDGAAAASAIAQRTAGLEPGPRTGGDTADAVVRYWTGVAEASTAYYRELARAMATPGTARTSQTARTAHPGMAAGPGDSSTPRARIQLDAVLGRSVQAVFSVANSDPQAAGIGIVPGPCRAADGQPFAAPATIEPSTATLGPGERIEVTVTVVVDPGLFAPDRTYVLPVRVDGPQPTGVDLVLAVREVDEDEVAGPPFRILCPTCERTFERSTRDRRLRRHDTGDGRTCSDVGLGRRLA